MEEKSPSELEFGTIEPGEDTDSADSKFQHVSELLDRVSQFPKQRPDKVPTILMYEIRDTGESSYKSMTLRELLQHVYLDTGEECVGTGDAGEEKVGSPFAAEGGTECVGELRLRDLRRLDFLFNPNEERALLVRRHVVLFAMDPVRALVMARRLVLIVPDGADSLLAMLDGYMRDSAVAEEEEVEGPDSKGPSSPAAPRLSGSAPGEHHVRSLISAVAAEVPFEARAYEALLSTVHELEGRRYHRLHAQLRHVLAYFRRGVLLPIPVHEQMRELKNELCALLRRIGGIRHTLTEVAEEEDDLALMNLTALRRRPALYRYPLAQEIRAQHDPMEELLEAYIMDFTALEGRILHAQSQIHSAEELLSLRLDTSRNQLLIVNTALAILGGTFGLGAYITGAFGMNLDQAPVLERTPYSFLIVIVGSLAVMLALFGGLVLAFHRRGIFPASVALLAADRRKLQ